MYGEVKMRFHSTTYSARMTYTYRRHVVGRVVVRMRYICIGKSKRDYRIHKCVSTIRPDIYGRNYPMFSCTSIYANLNIVRGRSGYYYAEHQVTRSRSV